MQSDNIFVDLLSCSSSAPVNEELRSELAQYLSTGPENVKDALLWWVEMRAVYPRLSRMARNYLSIPGMSICIPVCHRPHFLLATSTDVERVFSKGRLVLSHIRNRLSVASTRALMCLGAWSKLGLVRNADIKAAVILPDLVGEEAELEFGWDYITYD